MLNAENLKNVELDILRLDNEVIDIMVNNHLRETDSDLYLQLLSLRKKIGRTVDWIDSLRIVRGQAETAEFI